MKNIVFFGNFKVLEEIVFLQKKSFAQILFNYLQKE